MAGIIDRALCALWDWLGWVQEAHPTATLVGFDVLLVVGMALVGTLEYGTL